MKVMLGGAQGSSPPAAALSAVAHLRCRSCADDTVTLRLVAPLEPDLYSVYLRLLDRPGKAQLTIITARVCDCEGPAQGCPQRRQPATALPFILAGLGALLALLRELRVPGGFWCCGAAPHHGAEMEEHIPTETAAPHSHPAAAAALCEEEEGDQGATAAA